MLHIEIPGSAPLAVRYLVLDLNGTLAVDGRVRERTRELINQVAESVEVYVLTADTGGEAERVSRCLDAALITVSGSDTGAAKASFLDGLGAEGVVAVGNGLNDRLMLEKAALGILVLGAEGCAAAALGAADVLVRDIDDALQMLLKPRRLKATLRR